MFRARFLKGWLPLVGWCWAASLASAESAAQKMAARGYDKQSKGDFDGAITEYNRALRIYPKEAPIYRLRGLVEQKQNKNKEALADFDRAIELDPTWAANYTTRAILKGEMDDPSGAIADHKKAIELNANSAPSYSDRGLDKISTGDLGGAAADCEKGVELDPESPQAHRNRGVLRQVTGHWQEALADYRRAIELGADDAGYLQFYRWLMRVRLGQRETADHELAEYAQGMGRGAEEKWPREVAGFLLGQVKEDALLAAAQSSEAKKDRGQHCEAFYYVGMVRLSEGDKHAAADDFRRCLDTGARTFTEYEFAKAELAGLK